MWNFTVFLLYCMIAIVIELDNWSLLIIDKSIDYQFIKKEIIISFKENKL